MFAIPVKAQTPTTTYPVGDILPPTAPLTVDGLIAQSAQKYSVSGRLMAQIINCESQYVNEQSKVPDPTGPNGREDSWGLVQIHLHDRLGRVIHPGITRSMALDPVFSINYLALQLSLGNGGQWTCFGG